MASMDEKQPQPPLNKKKAFLLSLLSLISIGVLAYTGTPSGVIITVDYDEPSTFANNVPLTNLKNTTIFYDIGQGTVAAKIIAASNLKGGGHISQDLTVPILGAQEKTVKAWALATSTNALNSAISNKSLLLVDLLAPSNGITAGSITGTEIEVSYKEPTKKIDGSPLNDLLKTVILYDKGKGVTVAKEVPATSLNGGGSIKEKIIIPLAEDDEAFVSIWWVAYDTSLNASAPSTPIKKRLDRLPPAGPDL